MQFNVDVAVVGAGPAGAMAARALAESGVNTLLVERARLPRYKSCAGGIPVRTAALLPFDLGSVIEDEVRGINVSYRGQDRFTRWAKEPFAFMVMRDRFDNLLTERAAAAGAEVLNGAAVHGVCHIDGGFEIEAGQHRVRSRFLIGADGANSVVARATGLGAGLAESAALEAEVCARGADLTRWRGLVNVDYGYRPWGYGWVFPKQQRLSIGLVLPRNQGGDLRRHLRTYLDHMGLAAAEVERLVGHKLLLRRGHEPIAGRGVLLTGDAAGLADEFTEEGIYYAVKSGLLAATVVRQALDQGFASLSAYERMVDQRIMPELRAARTIARLFYGTLRFSPALLLGVSRYMGYFWNAFFRVQQGVTGYDDELARAWWLRPALPLVNRAAHGC